MYEYKLNHIESASRSPNTKIEQESAFEIDAASFQNGVTDYFKLISTNEKSAKDLKVYVEKFYDEQKISSPENRDAILGFAVARLNIAIPTLFLKF